MVSLIALLFSRDDWFFMAGVSMAMGVLSRLRIRGLLVASTSSAIGTNSGILLISMGVGCSIVEALYQIIACLQLAILRVPFT